MVKIAIGFITSKIIAVFVGPNGMALIGNLRNFLTSVEGVATLGFQNGIIKYVAEKENDEKELHHFLSSVLFCLLAVTVLLSILIYCFSGFLNIEIFGIKNNYQSVFKAFGIGLPWYIASLFLMSVLSGLGKFKKVIYINIFGNIVGFLASAILIYYFRTYGALLAVVLSPSLLFLVTVFFIGRQINFSLLSLTFFRFSNLKPLSEYSLMALVSLVIGPLVFLAIRKNVIVQLGLEQAGFWEAMNRISSYYLLFLTSVITIYFFPKLSKAANKKETREIFHNYYKWIVPVFLVALIVLYFLRDFVIHLLFTKTFLPVSGLFFWQLLGDFFKACSLILGYQFFAKKLTAAFIITELFSLSVMWISSKCLVPVFNIEGIVMAHALTYLIYLIVLCMYFRKSIWE
jgi:PST family polysaccharide transporter